MIQQMVVLATFSDGEVRDVTQEAFVESGNIEVVAAKREPACGCSAAEKLLCSCVTKEPTSPRHSR
jgi:hypothetical protein